MLLQDIHGRPELQLIVAAARPSLTPQVSERVRALASEKNDWSSVLHMAGEHAVRPLVYRTLHAICPEIVPANVLEELLSFIQMDVAHNLTQNGELVSLLNGLEERGIPAIPFKGGVLAEWAYADPSLRESGDIDIVTRKRHFHEAASFLLARDYRSRASDGSGPYSRFDRIDGLASVDLQTSLIAPQFSFALDIDELWQRVVKRSFGGQTVLSFCADDLLILLCVHGTKDLWFKLKWVCDIAAFLEREHTLNWDQVLVRATRLGATRRLLLGCLLAHDLLGASVPDAILNRIQNEPTVVPAARSVVGKYALSNRRYTEAERKALYFKTAHTRERARRVFRNVRRSVSVLVRPLKVC